MWKKRGRIFTPGKFSWQRHHGLTPTAVLRRDGRRIRIYYGATDKNKCGRVGFIEVAAADPSQVLYEHPDPVLDLGEAGAFDDSGVMPISVVDDNDGELMYYVGFRRCEKIGVMMSGGLAQRSEGETFTRVSRAPIVPLHKESPLANSAPTVIKEAGKYKMWYVSMEEYKKQHDSYYPCYSIRYAESSDGAHWRTPDIVCLAPQEGEIGISRTWVVNKNNGYEAWFSPREKVSAGRNSRFLFYKKICRATSADGLYWERDSSPQLLPSMEGWDSEMVCYPSVVEADGRTFMFYCGNENGKTGFGWAEKV